MSDTKLLISDKVCPEKTFDLKVICIPKDLDPNTEFKKDLSIL